jgi:predicted O-methyltransferase YrrM
LDIEPDLEALLEQLTVEGEAHDRREPDHARQVLNLEPVTAELISMLIRSSRRRRVLEIGTSNGYSTIWLAWAVGEEGRVTSLDRSEEKQRLAADNLVRAGLRDRVDLRCGEATELVSQLEDGLDCVFFDADRISAPQQLERLLPFLDQDVLLLADNAISHLEEISGYLLAVESMPDLAHTVVPVGKGLSLAHRR